MLNLRVGYETEPQLAFSVCTPDVGQEMGGCPFGVFNLHLEKKKKTTATSNKETTHSPPPPDRPSHFGDDAFEQRPKPAILVVSTLLGVL